MKKIKPLDINKIWGKVIANLDELTFKSTDDIKDHCNFIGQNRAISALQFGIRIKKKGFNIYVLGAPGIGRHAMILNTLCRETANTKPPGDWCYIHNFKKPQHPMAVEIPSGLGNKFKADMENLIDEFSTSLPNVFKSKNYHKRLKNITIESETKLRLILNVIKNEAKKYNLRIINKPKGFEIKYYKNQKILKKSQLEKLSPREQSKIKKNTIVISKELEKYFKKAAKFHTSRRKMEQDIKNEITMSAVWYSIDKLKKKYKLFPMLVTYLDDVQTDIIKNVDIFLKHDEKISEEERINTESNIGMCRYQVNVFVDNSETKSIPIIHEEYPIYKNLFGYVDHVSKYGALISTVDLIRPGSLHKANGGYLIIDAKRILKYGKAWQALKRALHAEKLVIEDNDNSDTHSSNILEPEAIPANLKIIMIGNEDDYYELYDEDSDFRDLFKVLAECEMDVDRNLQNIKYYISLIAHLVKIHNLKPFNRDAVTKIINHASRIAGDNHKLSIHMHSLIDILTESNYWADVANHHHVLETDVLQAIEAKIKRVDLIRENYFEEILRDQVFIQTSGEVIGQINGLLVLKKGDFTFGHPSRITATTRFGKGKFINIQREIDLSGSIHTKGVLILEGFLRGRYIIDEPLSLLVSIVFEQIYSSVDGDSASVAELCAVLSSIAQIPITQTLAVTGSINQFGNIQPIGCVNEKIEGFYDICKARNLTGHQGVIIPYANIPHLVLRDDVLTAIKQKRFHIYPLTHVDEALTLLTQTPAGTRSKNGEYATGTVNFKVESSLKNYLKHLRKYKKIDD